MWSTTTPLPQDSRRIGWQVSWGHPNQSCPLQPGLFEVVLELRSARDLPWTQADPDPTLAALQIQEQRVYEIRITPRPSSDAVLYFGDQPLASRSIGNTMLAEITPGNYVGPSRLLLQDGPHSLMDLPLEVRSRKLEYRDHYRQLLDALLEWSAELAYQFASNTQLRVGSAGPGRLSPHLTYLLLERAMRPDQLPAALDAIWHQPDRRLSRTERQTEIGQARTLSPRSLERMLVQPGQLAATTRSGLCPPLWKALRGKLPTHCWELHSQVDHDTAANRFLKKVLGELTQRALQVTIALEQRSRPKEPAQASWSERLAAQKSHQCKKWAQQLNMLGCSHWLPTVGDLQSWPGANPVLQRRQGYREVRQIYDQFNCLLKVRWSALERLLKVPNKNLATLYEYWCYLELCQVLASILGVKPDWKKHLKLVPDRCEVHLETGKQQRLRLGKDIWVKYNLEYARTRIGGSYSLPLRPDYSVLLPGKLWLFDAKYKFESGFLFDDEAVRKNRYKPDDLHKMHAYRDGILPAQGAFILYPGNVFCAFSVSGERYSEPESIPSDFEGVGAIPLLPGETGILRRFLERLLP